MGEMKPSKVIQAEQEKTAADILERLMDTIHVINLDMSGHHRYMLGHTSHGIIQEAKYFLYQRKTE